MAREILFRGKRVIDGKWVESCCPLGEMHSGTVTYDFVQDTVCQYTGLTDKNGRRYERDIFQASDGDCIQRYIITWNEDSLEWSAECIRDPEGTLPLSEFRVSEIEVIGNIFDNPELIEGRIQKAGKL